MDYLVVPTIKFKFLYILIIINHSTRKIEHFAVTSNPNVEWLKQQIRNVTPYSHKPKYLIHDNDGAFVSNDFQGFLSSCGIKSKRTAIHCPWQNPLYPLPRYLPTTVSNTKLKKKPVLGGMYHTYKKVA